MKGTRSTCSAVVLACAAVLSSRGVPARSASPHSSADPVVQGFIDLVGKETSLDSQRAAAVRDLGLAEAGRDKEPGAKAALDFFRYHTDRGRGPEARGGTDYAREREDMVSALATIAIHVAKKAKDEGRPAPGVVVQSLHALVETVKDPGEPWDSRLKAMEALSGFADSAPASTVADSSRMLEDSLRWMDEIAKAELPSGLFSRHPRRTPFLDRQAALKAALERAASRQ